MYFFCLLLRDSSVCFGDCIVIHSLYKSKTTSKYLIFILPTPPKKTVSLHLPLTLKESLHFSFNIKDTIGWNTELKHVVIGRKYNFKEQPCNQGKNHMNKIYGAWGEVPWDFFLLYNKSSIITSTLVYLEDTHTHTHKILEAI